MAPRCQVDECLVDALLPCQAHELRDDTADVLRPSPGLVGLPLRSSRLPTQLLAPGAGSIPTCPDKLQK
eukprot:8789936-Pyramimonas_sp.AAC.1